MWSTFISPSLVKCRDKHEIFSLAHFYITGFEEHASNILWATIWGRILHIDAMRHQNWGRLLVLARIWIRKVAFGSSTLLGMWAKEASLIRDNGKYRVPGTSGVVSIPYHQSILFQMINLTQRRRRRESNGETEQPSTAASFRPWSVSLSGHITLMLLYEKILHVGWTSLRPECR